MSDFKEAIDKTEDLARKIWLAGLGAYGQGLDNVQGGYDMMNEKTRKAFEELVSRGEKIEAEAKGRLEDTGDMLKEASDKLKAQGDKLVNQGEKLLSKTEQLKDEALKINITERLDEIRSKVADKLVLPELPKFDTQDKIEELSKRLEELTSAVTSLLKSATGKAKTAAKKAPAKKPVAKKAPAKKPAAKKAPAKAPAASKKPAAKKPAAKKAPAKKAPAAQKAPVVEQKVA